MRDAVICMFERQPTVFRGLDTVSPDLRASAVFMQHQYNRWER